MTIRNISLLGLFVGAIALGAWVCVPVLNAANDQKAKPAENNADKDLQRTRREVKMLDDIYKGSIVTITDQYVNDKTMIPAGTAFKKIFKVAEEKGWHTVRLVDATGEPYMEDNVAKDDFEKRAIKQLLEGESWVEAVETRKGTRHLRVATPIPVVFDKCIMCHENYEDVPQGQAIGALTYAVPIDGPLVIEEK